MRENRPYRSEGGEAKSLPYLYQAPQCDRLGHWRRACFGPWIASSQGLLAMTDGSPLTPIASVVIGRRLGSGIVTCAPHFDAGGAKRSRSSGVGAMQTSRFPNRR